jgi:DNA-binding Xre family transcriptional regulator
MKEEFYEFDPCEIDESYDEEEDENENSLDNWKPVLVRKQIVQSKWRKDQIKDNANQQPNLDDIRKIHMHLNKDVPDSEIMQVFGISCETLVAIKKDKYCPVDGIKFDTLSKIYKHFDFLERKLKYLSRANNYISKLIFMDDISLKKFKDYCENKQKPRPKNSNNKIELSESQG